jgi:hypothetical protein
MTERADPTTVTIPRPPPKQESPHIALIFSPDDWSLLEHLCTVLKSLQELSTQAEGEKYPTRARAWVLLRRFKRSIDEAEFDAQHANESAGAFCKSLRDTFDGRFPIHDADLLALVTHPKYKLYLESSKHGDNQLLRGLFTAQERTNAYDLLEERIKQHRERHGDPAAGPRVDEPVAIYADDEDRVRASLRAKPQTPSELIKSYKKHCFQLPAGLKARNAVPVQEEENTWVQLWVQESGNVFPEIAKLARVYQAVPATSALTERLFSLTGRLTRHERSRLHPDRMQQLVRLAFNSQTSAYPESDESNEDD